MSAVVIYEFMNGNTRAIAEAIAEGLTPLGEVEVRPVHEAGSVDAAEVLVVGGPTHMHGLSSSFSRRAAVRRARRTGWRSSRAPARNVGCASGCPSCPVTGAGRPPSTRAATAPRS